jgi:hypothetical protein
VKTLLLLGTGILIVWALSKRIPRPADRVSEEWLKGLQAAEGLDFDPEPKPAMRLVKTEVASAPKAYSRPVNG